MPHWRCLLLIHRDNKREQQLCAGISHRAALPNPAALPHAALRPLLRAGWGHTGTAAGLVCATAASSARAAGTGLILSRQFLQYTKKRQNETKLHRSAFQAAILKPSP